MSREKQFLRHFFTLFGYPYVRYPRNESVFIIKYILIFSLSTYSFVPCKPPRRHEEFLDFFSGHTQHLSPACDSSNLRRSDKFWSTRRPPNHFRWQPFDLTRSVQRSTLVSPFVPVRSFFTRPPS